jgi:hypothetical protein
MFREETATGSNVGAVLKVTVDSFQLEVIRKMSYCWLRFALKTWKRESVAELTVEPLGMGLRSNSIRPIERRLKAQLTTRNSQSP